MKKALFAAAITALAAVIGAASGRKAVEDMQRGTQKSLPGSRLCKKRVTVTDRKTGAQESFAYYSIRNG